jgi:hypothetical protein
MLLHAQNVSYRKFLLSPDVAGANWLEQWLRLRKRRTLPSNSYAVDQEERRCLANPVGLRHADLRERPRVFFSVRKSPTAQQVG